MFLVWIKNLLLKVMSINILKAYFLNRLFRTKLIIIFVNMSFNWKVCF